MGITTALVAGTLTVFSLNLYYNFHASSYDLVIFDQAVRSYAHFKPGISIVKGMHNGFGPNFSVLGDHFSPILASLAPLYWIYHGPQTLLVPQVVLLGASLHASFFQRTAQMNAAAAAAAVVPRVVTVAAANKVGFVFERDGYVVLHRGPGSTGHRSAKVASG